MNTKPDPDWKAAAAMLVTLADTEPSRRLDTLALVAKVVIEGHLPRFEDILRREGGREKHASAD